MKVQEPKHASMRRLTRAILEALGSGWKATQHSRSDCAESEMFDPPVAYATISHPTFGDFMVTADWEAYPDDRMNLSGPADLSNGSRYRYIEARRRFKRWLNHLPMDEP